MKVTCDVTVTDTLAQSYLPMTSQTLGTTAEECRTTHAYSFMAIVCETMGVINYDGIKFLDDLGRRITQVTDDSPTRVCLPAIVGVDSALQPYLIYLPTQPPRTRSSRSS